MIPLVDTIAPPDTNNIVQTHPGVAAFFEPFQLPFIVENADFAAFLVSLGVLAYSGYVQLKNLRANRQIKTLISHLKNSTPQSTSTNQAAPPPPASPTSPTSPTAQLTQDLEALFILHRELDQDFKLASSNLDPEGLQAFSEAYKSAREIVERAIEDKQRRFSSIYVKQVVDLLKQARQEQESLEALSQRLDETFVEASETLTQVDIFSRESFRTFTEAYDIARETIERKKVEQGTHSA